jgi:23S rRNA (uracil1939-C5)-methyltransferase
MLPSRAGECDAERVARARHRDAGGSSSSVHSGPVPSRPSKSSEVELRIDSLAFGGRGVARLDDFVLFVDRALPGDLVRARVTKVKRRYGEAAVVETIERGPDRVPAPCPHFGACGGCRWQDLDYAAQLREKTAQVREAITRIGHQSDFVLDDVLPANRTYGYRNKLEYSWTQGPHGPSLGFHRAGRWDQVLPIEVCLLMGDEANEARRAVEDWARTHDLEAYDRRAHRGFLRNLIVRGSDRTGQLLLTLVTTSDGELPATDELEEELRRRVPGCVGFLHGVNDGVSEVTAGLAATPLFGRDWYEESLLDLRLRVSSGAFVQTNTDMCERLYELAIEEAGLHGDEVVWDLYSGIGSIALAMARHAGRVYGIEVVEEAVERAVENAERNGVENATFVAGDVAHAVRPLLESGIPRPDVVVLDPPRAGLTPKAVRRVLELAPRRIVYVSCNPTTLAGNAELLTEAGYRLERVRAVDMFPHTAHVECVARFEAPAPEVAGAEG